MSKEGDRQSVFRTTKVRTFLKGDSSWIQHRSEPEAEQEQEKPWLAEVRANSANGVFADPSPSISPTAASCPPPASPSSGEGAKASSGYLIRGVFTRTNSEKASSVANGTGATSTTVVKKPTENYKKIAPHILRSSAGNLDRDDDLLSPEEHERRTEAASSVLSSGAKRQRSYVLSAAKKYEAADKPQVTPSFVAKRVEITEDDEPPAPTLPSSKDDKMAVEQKMAAATNPAKSSPDVNTFAALSDTLVPQKSNTPSTVDTKTPSLALDPNSPVATQKPSAALKPSPLSTTSSKLAVEQKTETSPLKSSLVDVQKVSPAPEPSPTTPESSKNTKLPAEQNTQASPVKTSSLEAAKPSPALDPSPLIVTSSKDTKQSVEQKPKAESSPVKPSSVDKQEPSTALDPNSDSIVDLLDPFPVDTTKSVKKEKPAGGPPSSSSTKPADPTPVKTFSIKSTIDPVALSESDEDSKPTEISDRTVDLLDPFPVDTTKSSPAPSDPWTSTESKQRMDNMESGALKALADTVIPFNTNTSDSIVDLLDPFPVDTTKSSPAPSDPWTSKESKQRTDNREGGALDALTDTVILLNTNTASDSIVDLLDPFPVDTIKSSPAPSDPRTSTESKQSVKKENAGGSSLSSSSTKPVDPTPVKTFSIKSDSTVALLDQFPVDTIKSDKKEKTAEGPPSSSSTKPADPTPVKTFSIKSTIDPVALSESDEDSKPTEISDRTVDLLDPFPVDTTKSSLAPSDPWTSTESKQMTDNTEGGALDALADTVIPFNTNTSPEESSPTFDRKTECLSESSEGSTDDSTSGQQKYTITFERQSFKDNSPWSKWTSPTVSDYTETKTYSSSPSTMDRTFESVSQETNSSDSESKKGFVFVKEYVNTSAVSLQNTGFPSDEQRSSDYVYSTSSSHSYSSPPSYSGTMSACTYCGKMVGSENRITIEHLNISCHPACFKCAVCNKPMGDLLYNMFLHSGVVHCESCYANAI